ncbi:MAG: 23S rRNA (guanosine(2251)-2'-O)-methyltransferase RlmB [Coriobacteriia bacterium]|nr:23S rRNA (guanosine(2251)-2'-O)-methyltransferase RlmB [Coriobacteriia bacterium]
MSELIEGRNAVLEALRSNQEFQRVLIARGVKPNATLDEIRLLAKTASVRVVEVDRAELDRLSPRGAHQGVAAEAAPFRFAELADVLRRTVDATASLIVVLDHVTDPGNLGAIIRSVEVAGGDAVIVAKDRSAPVTAVVHKASAGATAHLPVVRVVNICQTLRALKDAGFWVLGASEKAELLAWETPFDGRIALVMGAEGAGLSRVVQEACDLLVRLPVHGHISSLNVAQATTVLAFEWVRRSRR